MSKYTMGVSVGKPGQTSAVVIVSRGQEDGRFDQMAMRRLSIKIIEVQKVERLPAGLKDAEIVVLLNRILGQAPLTGNTGIMVEHPGGAPAIEAMKSKFRTGAFPWGVQITTSDESGWTNGLRPAPLHKMVSYLVPVCEDALLRIPEEFTELNAQMLNLERDRDWRSGEDDLASALLIAAWFSREQGGFKSQGLAGF
jgi:hypothetical protein